MNYFDFRRSEAKCPRCEWSGAGHEASSMLVTLDSYEHACPKCSARIGMSPVPTLEEARQNLDELSEEERLKLEKSERAHKAYLQKILKRPDQLPELEGNALELQWDHDSADDGRDLDLVIRHGEKEVWREPAYFECYRRFEEIANLLSIKYGARLKDLVPSRESLLYLYGDAFAAEPTLEEVRRGLRTRHHEAMERENVVQLDAARVDQARYEELLRHLPGILEQMQEGLFTTAVNLAMSKAWRNWDRQQAVESQVRIDTRALLESGDPNVSALARLCAQIAECRSALSPRDTGTPDS